MKITSQNSGFAPASPVRRKNGDLPWKLGGSSIRHLSIAMTAHFVIHLTSAFAALPTLTAPAAAQPAPVTIVAIGASNTWGSGSDRPQRLS